MGTLRGVMAAVALQRDPARCRVRGMRRRKVRSNATGSGASETKLSTSSAGGGGIDVQSSFRALVQEEERSLDLYVRLPVEKYNLLDESLITRVDENTFRISGAPS